MNRIMHFLHEIAGLFFDDGSLAIVVLLILAATAALLHAASFSGPMAMFFLVGGVTAALLENVVRSARARPPGK